MTEFIKPNPNKLEIGLNHYEFSQNQTRYFEKGASSSYQKDTSVIIINEPHESTEGQFNLFKGLEAFFSDNPQLIKHTIFLSEGTPANKPISVNELIKINPHPSDEIILRVLQSHLITGYMAYEWKHQKGIPIIGTEDEGLFVLSRRWASMCRDNPNAIFQRRKFEGGHEHILPLSMAWAFVVAARNKQIAATLVERTKTHKNPILFVAWDHMVDERKNIERKWDSIIKRNIVSARYMGIFGFFQFEPEVMGVAGELHGLVPEDSETFDIHHYLEQAKIGYTFINPIGETTEKDTEDYNKIFRSQK